MGHLPGVHFPHLEVGPTKGVACLEEVSDYWIRVTPRLQLCGSLSTESPSGSLPGISLFPFSKPLLVTSGSRSWP